MKYVLGIDAGGTKTRALLADTTGRVLASATGGGANLRTHGELEVEKVLHALAEEAEGRAGVRADALAVGIAGADRPDDHAVLRTVLRRIGFKDRVVVTNDARIAFVAGSPLRVGVALVCGTGSIAWGCNGGGEIARAGGWGWHLGDEGSGFWIGERALRAAMRAGDGRGPRTVLVDSALAHFRLSRLEEIVRCVYDAEYPRHEVSLFAVAVARGALAGDEVASEILREAAAELALAASSVVARLGLAGSTYDVVLSGGTFGALPRLQEEVARAVSFPGASVFPLAEEPALGAVRLAIEALSDSTPIGDPSS